MDTVFLIDGSSIFFRAYHAIQDLRRSDGTATNALYGYLLSMRSILNDRAPSRMVVAFDRREKTFREDLFPDYKANRESPPDDLIAQIPMIQEATALLGIHQTEIAGYEADDLIGTMARWLSENGRDTIIVSGDKDLLQLIDDRVSLLRLQPNNKSMMYTATELYDRYGVSPQQFIDVLGLMGDAVDNVPGVPGIGEKTAIALIQEFGSMEGIYDNIDKVTGKKRKENLLNFRDQAFLSKELVTIKCDIEMEMSEDLFTIRKADDDALRDFYQRMEFRSFYQELSQPTLLDQPSDYQTIHDMDELCTAIETIENAGHFAFDTETTSLHPITAELVGISLTVEDHQGWYLPLGHKAGGNVGREKAIEALKPLFASDKITKVAHHAKYDGNVLQRAGIDIRNPLEDTLLASVLLHPEMQSHKLDDLALRQLNMRMTPITDLIGTGKKQITMADVAVEDVSHYACEDTDATWQLWELFGNRIQPNGIREIYYDIEIPLLRVLGGMERRGIRVDSNTLQEQSKALDKELKDLEEGIYRSVGKEFNINSPAQLAEIIYDDLKLLTGRKRSTRADIMEKLAGDGVEFAQQVLEYRHRKKIQSTYLDSLSKLVHPETGRVHTTYHQSGTNTGRISSSDPNLQNIPTRTDLGRRVRQAFVAPEGFRLLSLDYSQIELRILAQISKDPGLLQAFSSGEDIHRRTAAEVFEVALDEVTPDMRRKAKEINFGLNYGMSPYGLAKRLNIGDKEAELYIETYFARYPRVLQYMDETVAFAKEHRYVTTTLGRRIPTHGIDDSNRNRQENAKRAAINAPIQGSAADLLKAAMVKLDRELLADSEDAFMLLTVHDELVLEVKDGRIDEIERQCKDIMEHALELDVPTPVECFQGSNWAELK